MKAKLIKTIDGYELFTQGFLKGSTNHGLIESLNIEEGPIRYKLSLKNCHAIELGYDLDELAKREYLDGYDTTELCRTAFKDGFQKALEILGDKKFTLDDIYTVFIMGREGMEDKMNRYVTRIHEPTEWDVEILEECLDKDCDGLNRKGECITTGKPKLDADGCLILKRV